MEIVTAVTSRLAGCISLGEVSPVGAREIRLHWVGGWGDETVGDFVIC
jgi:hypothetical protein